LAAHPVLWNVLALAIADLTLVLRTIYEERTLARDAAYARYRQAVRWRLVPGCIDGPLCRRLKRLAPLSRSDEPRRTVGSCVSHNADARYQSTAASKADAARSVVAIR
jgi:hypothetical protein